MVAPEKRDSESSSALVPVKRTARERSGLELWRMVGICIAGGAVALVIVGWILISALTEDMDSGDSIASVGTVERDNSEWDRIRDFCAAAERLETGSAKRYKAAQECKRKINLLVYGTNDYYEILLAERDGHSGLDGLSESQAQIWDRNSRVFEEEDLRGLLDSVDRTRDFCAAREELIAAITADDDIVAAARAFVWNAPSKVFRDDLLISGFNDEVWRLWEGANFVIDNEPYVRLSEELLMYTRREREPFVLDPPLSQAPSAFETGVRDLQAEYSQDMLSLAEGVYLCPTDWAAHFNYKEVQWRNELNELLGKGDAGNENE